MSAISLEFDLIERKKVHQKKANAEQKKRRLAGTDYSTNGDAKLRSTPYSEILKRIKKSKEFL